MNSRGVVCKREADTEGSGKARVACEAMQPGRQPWVKPTAGRRSSEGATEENARALPRLSPLRDLIPSLDQPTGACNLGYYPAPLPPLDSLQEH